MIISQNLALQITLKFEKSYPSLFRNFEKSKLQKPSRGAVDFEDSTENQHQLKRRNQLILQTSNPVINLNYHDHCLTFLI